MKSSCVFSLLALASAACCTSCGHPPESASPEPMHAPSAQGAPSANPTGAPSSVAAGAASATATSTATEPPPPATPSPFAGPAMQKNPNDLGWLSELIRVLADEPATREHVSAYLGTDAGADMQHVGGRLVRGHSPYFEKVAVYQMPHVHIEVALDIAFAANSRPGRSAIQSAVGPLQSLPRAPDDISSGAKLAHYREGKHGRARVFIELDPKNETQVASIHVDVDGVKN